MSINISGIGQTPDGHEIWGAVEIGPQDCQDGQTRLVGIVADMDGDESAACCWHAGGFKYVVAVGPVLHTLREQDPRMAEAIIAHELGHVALGHLEDDVTGRHLEREIAADAWAAERGYASDLVKALFVSTDITESTVSDDTITIVDRDELAERVDALMPHVFAEAQA